MKHVVPTASPQLPITPAQKTFRTLIQKVESLRKSIDAEEADLESLLTFHSQEIVPRLAAQTARQKDTVRALAPFINKSFFPGKDERHQFRELMRCLLDEISTSERGLADADLQHIFNVFNGVGYAVDEQKTIAATRAALRKMFADEGIEIDLTELDSATSEADFMLKAEALIARARKMKEAEAEAAHCSEHGHGSSDDENMRAAEELRKRSIANIYKKLARVLHPDFERDSDRLQQKVELMQELTEAYRQNDLHTLLRLEMEWILNEEGNIERLTEEKLGVYNEVLAEQARGLEVRLRDLIFQPRYRPITVFDNGLTRPVDGAQRARELDNKIAALERSIAVMETAQTSADVRAAIALLP